MSDCETYTASEARNNLSEVINKAIYKGPVVIKRGKDSVAVISLELLRLFTELEAKSDVSEAKKALSEYETKGGTSLDAIKREFGID